MFATSAAFATGITPLTGGNFYVFRKNLGNRAAAAEIVSSLDASQSDQTTNKIQGLRPTTNSNGRYVIYESPDTLAGADGVTNQIFWKDMNTLSSASQIVSSTDNTTGNKGTVISQYASVDDSGMLVVFQSASTNWVTGSSLTQVWLKNMNTPAAAPILVSSTDSTQANQTAFQGNGNSTNPRISHDGRYVVFVSSATNFCGAGCAGSQVYRKDLNNLNLTPTIVSSTDYSQANQAAFIGNATAGQSLDLSGDGQYVVFQSTAANFVTGGSLSQIYRRDMSSPTGAFVLVSSLDSSQANQGAFKAATGTTTSPRISYDGSRVFFISQAKNMQTIAFAAGVYRVFAKDLTSLSNPTQILTTLYSNAADPNTYASLNSSFRSVPISSDGRYVILQGQSQCLMTGASSSGQLLLKDLLNLIP